MADEATNINMVPSGKVDQGTAHFDCKVFSQLPKNAVGTLTAVVRDDSGKQLFRQDFGLWCYVGKWSEHHFEYPMGDRQSLECEYTYFVESRTYGPVVTTAALEQSNQVT